MVGLCLCSSLFLPHQNRGLTPLNDSYTWQCNKKIYTLQGDSESCRRQLLECMTEFEMQNVVT